MTHDELLAKVTAENESIRIRPVLALNALRAVVELHKPFIYEGRMGKFERCSGCSSEEEWLGEIYPCETIEAIEKELA